MSECVEKISYLELHNLYSQLVRGLYVLKKECKMCDILCICCQFCSKILCIVLVGTVFNMRFDDICPRSRGTSWRKSITDWVCNR